MKNNVTNPKDSLTGAWHECPVEAIAKTTSGGTPDRKRDDFYGGEIPWVKSGELNDSYIYGTEETLTPEGLKNSSAKFFPAGTLLIAMYGATVGKTAILKVDAATNQAVCAIFPNEEKADADFLRFYLMSKRDALLKQRYGGAQPNISQNIIRSFPVRLPPLPEQRKIARVLVTVQRANEQQERLIALTVELKMELKRQLFTCGVHGEPQKETEIGLVPVSWEVTSLERVAESFDYGTSVKCDYDKDGFPVLRIPNVIGGKIDLSDLKKGQPKRTEMNILKLRSGDLIFVRTNGVQENAGRCAVFCDELPECYFASYLIRVRLDHSQLLPAFLNEYAQTVQGKSFLSGRAIRTADGKFNINAGTLRSVLLPRPPIEEQAEIVSHLDLLERKARLHRRKHAVLSDLFRTLLHQLMTGQIRVDDLDLSELEPLALAAE